MDEHEMAQEENPEIFGGISSARVFIYMVPKKSFTGTITYEGGTEDEKGNKRLD
jgi:hypothetical protein